MGWCFKWGREAGLATGAAASIEVRRPGPGDLSQRQPFAQVVDGQHPAGDGPHHQPQLAAPRPGQGTRLGKIAAVVQPGRGIAQNTRPSIAEPASRAPAG